MIGKVIGGVQCWHERKRTLGQTPLRLVIDVVENQSVETDRGSRPTVDLVREARANEAAFRARVRTVLRSSYSSYYRRISHGC